MRTKMAIFLLTPLLLITAVANADETSPQHSDLKLFDLQLDPANISYSNYYGLTLGVKTALAVTIDPHWQWKLGGSYSINTRFDETGYTLFTGPQYNFSEDHARSYFIGFGPGYSNLLINGAGYMHTGYYAYLEFGKRWALNDTGTWTFSPYASLRFDGQNSGLSIQPLSFTFSF